MIMLIGYQIIGFLVVISLIIYFAFVSWSNFKRFTNSESVWVYLSISLPWILLSVCFLFNLIKGMLGN